MMSVTELRAEQASHILDALEEHITCAAAITIYRGEDGRVGIRHGTTGCALGSSVRDALAQMLTGRVR